MMLVCGATGELGGRIARLLRQRGQDVRALVRPMTDAAALEDLGVEVVRGDLRDAASLAPAVAGVDVVLTTATAIVRLLAGPTDLSIDAVDRAGNLNLARAAERAGVRRFVFVSAAAVEGMAPLAPAMAAKVAVEQGLRGSPLEVVVVRPDMFQEVWLGPAAGIDAAAHKATIYGRGRQPHRYVAEDDVAALCVHLALADAPPRVVEFGGPDPLSCGDAVAALEAATGQPFTVRHVPRPLLAVAGRALARPRPALASLMGMALYSDTHAGTWDDRPLRAAGIEPRPARAFLDRAGAASG